MFASTIQGVTGKRLFLICIHSLYQIYMELCVWKNDKCSIQLLQFRLSRVYKFLLFVFLWSSTFSVYLITLVWLGQVGDRMSLKYFVLAGTFSTSVLFTLIGVMINCNVQKNYVFLILQTFNGISQGTAWPGLLAILNNWFMTDKKVILLGIFAACTNVGDIIGDVYSGSLIGRDDLPLYAPIYLAALSLFIVSVLNLFFLENSPNPELKKQMIAEYEKGHEQQVSQDLQLSMMEKQFTLNGAQDISKTQSVVSQIQQSQYYFEEPQLNYLTAWLVPGVAIYALSFGCVKAVYYILGFWLPSYLDTNHVPDVAWITAQIDVGSIPGGIIICCIGYYFNKRAVVIVPALWIGTVIMISINYSGDLKHEVAGYICLVFLTGLFIGGCYNNISSAITVELSNQPELKNSKQATATVVSVIMGYGAMFAAINQLVVPRVEKVLFLYCGFLAVIAGLLLIPFLIREIKRQQKNY